MHAVTCICCKLTQFCQSIVPGYENKHNQELAKYDYPFTLPSHFLVELGKRSCETSLGPPNLPKGNSSKWFDQRAAFTCDVSEYTDSSNSTSGLDGFERLSSARPAIAITWNQKSRSPSLLRKQGFSVFSSLRFPWFTWHLFVSCSSGAYRIVSLCKLQIKAKFDTSIQGVSKKWFKKNDINFPRNPGGNWIPVSANE